MKVTRPRIILAVLLLAIGVSAVWWGPWVWWQDEPFVVADAHVGLNRVMRLELWLEEEPPALSANGAPARHNERWVWILETGVLVQHWDRLQKTYWSSVGELEEQYDGARLRQQPPWRWGKTDQTEPTLPTWLREWAEEEIARREAEGK